MGEFEGQIAEMERLFTTREDDRDRVGDVVDALRAGNYFFPVLIHQNDPQRQIKEGMHRAVALRQLRGPTIAAFLVGYADWFAS